MIILTFLFFSRLPTYAEHLPNLGVACLPKPRQPLPVHKLCTIIGWGKRRSTDVYGAELLHEAQVNITKFHLKVHSIASSNYAFHFSVLFVKYLCGTIYNRRPSFHPHYISQASSRPLTTHVLRHTAHTCHHFPLSHYNGFSLK